MANKMNPLETASNTAKDFLLTHWKILLAITIIQVIAYSYLLTGITFTNHTFPNVWLNPYPSYRTQEEGRWMADILIHLAGGSGNQSVQMSIAIFLQAVNGTLFAKWLGLKRHLHIFLIAALLCLFPPFLDYYGFAIDHIAFVFGDTLCIFGAYLLKRGTLLSVLTSSLLYGLSLAVYGPKISFVSFTAISSIILRATEANPSNTTIKNGQMLKELLVPAFSVAVTMTIYWITYKLSAPYSAGIRTHTNSFEEVIPEFLKSYSTTIQFFTGDLGGLPNIIRLMPLMIIVAGASVAAASALLARGGLATLLVLISVFLSPAAINATWIINKEAWPTPGRLYTAYAYFFLFYLSFLLQWRPSRKIIEFTTLAMIYLFFTLASQQANALELKTAYETSFINRIVQRVEPLLPDKTTSDTRPGLVIIGDIPPFDVKQYVRFQPHLGVSHALNTQGFVSYRHIDIFNFFLGRQGVRRPTSSEQKAVIEESRNAQPWPSQQATFSTSQVIGVVLEKYRPGGSVTWHDKQ
jgi:hypothetical protein